MTARTKYLAAMALAAAFGPSPVRAAPPPEEPRGYAGPTKVESQELPEETEPLPQSMEAPLGGGPLQPAVPTKEPAVNPESAREQGGAAMLTAGITTPFFMFMPHTDWYPTALITGFFGGHLAKRAAMGLCAQLQTDSNVLLHSYQVAWMGRMEPRTELFYLVGVGPFFLAGSDGAGGRASLRLGARLTDPGWRRHGIVIAGTLDIGFPLFFPSFGISLGWAWM